MKKCIIGLVPTARLFDTDDYYKDNYLFVNNYAKRVAENGGVPLGVLAADGYAIEESLQACDGFVFCGGNRIFPYHFQAMEHAVQSGKPVLGVCLGMQTMHSYFLVEDEAKRRGWDGPLLALYEAMKKERYMFTEPVEHHWDVHMTRGHIDEAKHPVAVEPGTLLHRLTGRQTLWGATMHRYRITQPSPRLTGSARAADGTAEAIECGERLLGVQFHPEVDREHDALFAHLVRLAGSRP